MQWGARLASVLLLAASGCGTVDAGAPPDGAPADAPPPHPDGNGWAEDTNRPWPPPCTIVADCPTWFAYCVEGVCRQCLADSDCAAPVPRCRADGACVPCFDDADCHAGRPACVDNGCVECRWPADCPADRPWCGDSGACVQCLEDADCPAARPRCSNVNGYVHCVECVSDAGCPTDRSYCGDGFCSACCLCGCTEGALPQYPRSSLDCEAACTHIPGVCHGTMAGCEFCAGLPSYGGLAGCMQVCGMAAMPYGSSQSALWGCLAAHEDCGAFAACYRAACTVPATSGPGCMLGPCDAPLAGGANHGPGVVGDPCVNPNDCESTNSCYDGVCACRPGFTACWPHDCVDLGSDPVNCGTCGWVCPPGQSCCSGACTT